jgi:hypothetical protein
MWSVRRGSGEVWELNFGGEEFEVFGGTLAGLEEEVGGGVALRFFVVFAKLLLGEIEQRRKQVFYLDLQALGLAAFHRPLLGLHAIK